jgi:hypothetical protein
MFKKKPETILVTKVFIDKQLVAETAKVVEDGPDWFRRIFLAVAIPAGFWLMVMGEMI